MFWVKKILATLYYSNGFWSAILHPLRKINQQLEFYFLSDKAFYDRLHFQALGTRINWKNPTMWSEKIHWLKLYDRSPLKVTCADKVNVRRFVSDKIGEEYLIPNYLHTSDINEIKKENFPDCPVIVKINHDSFGGVVIRDKNQVEWNKLRSNLKNRLSKTYYNGSREWQYKKIEHQILVEKLLLDENNAIPNDMKFYCFNGVVRLIHVDVGRDSNHTRSFFDRDWNYINVTYVKPKGAKLPRPKQLDRMISISEKLSTDFIFVRVDLYNVIDKIYFGELTFTPTSGLAKWKPEEYDRKIAEMIQLPTRSGSQLNASFFL